ncbi:GcrA family cell cycle regulator [Pelagibacterium lentulum]|uniref:GcrA cell cycle regulator n=1 Tax=Pelagibacterium lentulum TaxID=2029865 RepID=A0A916W3N0_9HYPH|nr:GcrA family cell cycle regulator [Pelagibacterium lentulum]GGA63753.1 hypothetical protein GCM10011499_37650 [Pelagibacterium lentulum]
MSAIQMSRFATEWPEADIARLRAYWDEGLTAAEIAKRLGYGRNAVLGKIFRLKLPKRRDARTGETSRRPIKAVHTRKRTPKGDKIANVDATGMKILRSDVWTALPGTSPVPLLERTGCRWPIDGEGGVALFCNGCVDGGQSYCAAHGALAPRHDPESEDGA